MNAVVKPDDTLDDSAIEAGSKAIQANIDNATGATSLNPLVVAREAFKYNAFGKQAVVQADKAVLDSAAKFGLGGDLMKAITQNLKALEETRMGYTRGLDTLKDYIMALFAPGKKKLTEAKAALQTKLDTYLREEQKRVEAEQATKAKALEDAALNLATAQQAMGDSEGADKVLEGASKMAAATVADTKVTGHGVYGATISGTKRWIGAVTNPAQFLAWLIINRPESLLSIVEFKTAELNKLAKELGAAKCEGVPGFKFEQTTKASTR